MTQFSVFIGIVEGVIGVGWKYWLSVMIHVLWERKESNLLFLA